MRRSRGRGASVGGRRFLAPRVVAIAAVVGVLSLDVTALSQVTGSETTNSVDTRRTGWDPGEPTLAPSSVTVSTFGQVFSASVSGQVYAQPLVLGNTLLVGTESNDLYGLDATTGAQLWHRNLGAAWPASAITCGDLTPTIGITSTPVIDPARGIAYLLSKTYNGTDPTTATWFAHAVDVATGAEQPGWPVTIAGTAANDPASTFKPFDQLQRPGLLFKAGVVYAAFGSHCDHGPYQGWVASVSVANHRLVSLWTDEVGGGPGNPGGGIWQAGSGLVSDGPGRIFLTTGNGPTSPPGPGTSPSGHLGEAVVHLSVNADGTGLKAVDYFTPYNADTLNHSDQDLGSGGPVALPDSFGTTGHPHLMAQGGKEGKLSLLDRDNLGGRTTTAPDRVLSQNGPYGPIFSRVGVWGGDGGWVYLPTSGGPLRAFQRQLDGEGNPTLVPMGASIEHYGFASGAPVVTSNGTTSGSALVWVVASCCGSGTGAELRAYDALPVAGVLHLRWRHKIGTASKFSMPAVSNGKVYVGTRDGRLLAFGSLAPPPALSGGPQTFSTQVGVPETHMATLTASTTVSVTSASTTNGLFTLGSPTPGYPAHLGNGGTLQIPVTFTPTSVTTVTASLSVASSAGTFKVSLTGTGQPGPFTVSPPSVDFGPVVAGHTASTQVVFSNNTPGTIRVTSNMAPNAPFAASGLPSAGLTLGGRAQLAVAVTFAPTTPGTYSSSLTITTSAAAATVLVSGSLPSNPGHMVLSPNPLNLGSVAVGQSSTLSFTVANTGGNPITINLAKAPAGVFASPQPLNEGTIINPGNSVPVPVTFSPAAAGAATDKYTIASDDGQGAIDVVLQGTGTTAGPGIPDPTAGGWTLNGSASLISGALQLTAQVGNQHGSAFWPNAVSSSDLTLHFDETISGGTGADGLTLAFIDPSEGATALGTIGSGLGFSGLTGVAVAVDTHSNGAVSSNNFIGLSTGVGPSPESLTFASVAASVPPLHNASHHIDVVLQSGDLRISIDGSQVIDTTNFFLPSQVLVGFTGATGASFDAHSVSNLVVS